MRDDFVKMLLWCVGSHSLRKNVQNAHINTPDK
jgi:hypothetical protein